MGSKRVGFARTAALIENLKRSIDFQLQPSLANLANITGIVRQACQLVNDVHDCTELQQRSLLTDGFIVRVVLHR